MRNATTLALVISLLLAVSTAYAKRTKAQERAYQNERIQALRLKNHATMLSNHNKQMDRITRQSQRAHKNANDNAAKRKRDKRTRRARGAW